MEVLVEDDGVIRLPTDVLESLGMTVGSKLVCSAEVRGTLLVSEGGASAGPNTLGVGGLSLHGDAGGS